MMSREYYPEISLMLAYNLYNSMRIVHLCGTAYIDGWGYQDNLLPQYQQKMGLEVHVIAPANHFPSYLNVEARENIIKKGKEYDHNGVHIHRINTYLSTSNFSFIYSGLFRKLREIKPDIIFNHGVAAPLLIKSALYTSLNKNVKLVIDNHADYINCSKNKAWHYLYNRGLERIVAKLCSKVIHRAYGVTPLRCDYLRDVYGFDQKKIELLPIGADTDSVKSISLTKKEIRNKYGMNLKDFLIVSGGKMGVYKGTDNLIEAYKSLKKDFPSLRLILFGKFEDKKCEQLAKKEDGVEVLGWCDRKKTLEILKMADIACWPIHHTTLIEDAVACSVPLILRQTGNTEHLIRENGQFVKRGSVNEIEKAIISIIGNYEYFKRSAEKFCEELSYDSIARKVFEDC